MNEYITPQEVADRLKVSTKTVRRWIQEGRLPAVKAGHFWRVREEALEYFLVQTDGETSSHEGETRKTQEDREWLKADLGADLPPFDWGPKGPPKGRPVRYEPGIGPVIEAGQE